MTIDSVTEASKILQLYENQKTVVISEILSHMRKLQASQDIDRMKQEMDILINIVRRIDAVISEEFELKGLKPFKNKLYPKLSQQKLVLEDIKKLANAYKNGEDPDNLNALYTKIYEAIQSFKTISKYTEYLLPVKKDAAIRLAA